MIRANKGKVFLGEEGITQDAMMAYLQNRLTAEERQQFEKLLADDPFAAEALEGLQSLTDNNKVASSLQQLQNQVKERSGIKTRRSISLHWSAYAWAAVVLGLLIGIGFLMTNYLMPDQQEIAQATATQERILPESEQPAEPLLIPDAVAESQAADMEKSLSEEVATGKLQEQTNEMPAPTETKATVTATVKEDVNGNAGARADNNKALTTFSTQAPPKNEQQAAPAPVLEDKRTEGDADIVQTAAARKAVKTVELNETLTREKTAATGATNVTLDDAMKSFNAGDYKSASAQFDAVLKQSPDNADALYFGGIADYINGNNNKSEKQFDKLLKTNRYTDGSKWYKANILIKKGKKADAKKLLQELSATSGSYKERALKKLEELEN